jgi:hypothetical protein
VPTVHLHAFSAKDVPTVLRHVPDVRRSRRAPPARLGAGAGSEARADHGPGAKCTDDVHAAPGPERLSYGRLPAWIPPIIVDESLSGVARRARRAWRA